MQLSSFVIALLATSVSGAMHFRLQCVNVGNGGAGAFDTRTTTNQGATRASCAAYRNRNTGNNHWDKCPDCFVETVNGVAVCQSNMKHMGGDEFQFYCKQNGATRSQIS